MIGLNGILFLWSELNTAKGSLSMLTMIKKYQWLVFLFILSVIVPVTSFAAARGYVLVDINTPVVARTHGFVIVNLVADTTVRYVEANGVVDGETVASGSAADNVGTIISSAQQSFTFPVRKGATWEVKSQNGSAKVEVRWFTFGISF